MQDQHSRLTAILLTDAWYRNVLQAARAAGLPDYAIAGGFVRNAVWDHLHDVDEQHRPRDIDVAYFDPNDLSEARDLEVATLLRNELSTVEWEPSNQAAAHRLGLPGVTQPPLSLEATLATWPETVTSIGVRLNPDDSLTIIAPFGLDDLFEMKLRRNPACLTQEQYQQRLRRKGIRESWPLVSVLST